MLERSMMKNDILALVVQPTESGLQANPSETINCKHVLLDVLLTIHYSRELTQARVVQKVDNAMQWINHYPANNMVCFVNNYLLDRD